MPTPLPNLTSSLVPGTWDSFNRILSYINVAQQNAERHLNAISRDPNNHMRYRQAAVDDRNALLEAVRARSSPFGRAFSEALKEEGKSQAELTDLYIDRLRRDPSRLISPKDRFRAAGRAVIVGRDLEAGQVDWEKARRAYMLNVLGAMAGNVSPALSRKITAASGRTNQLVNRLAYVQAGVGVVAATGAGAIAIATWSGSTEIPEGVLQTLTISDWQTCAVAASSILTAVGVGYLVRQVGRTNFITERSTGQRVGAVVVINIGLFFLLMWLFRFLIGLGFDEM